MENLAGVGWIGAVFIGTILIATRDPIIGAISLVSNRLLPEVHTREESIYLDVYKIAQRDRNISEKERNMLNSLATTYGLSNKRLAYLENWYETNQMDASSDE